MIQTSRRSFLRAVGGVALAGPLFGGVARAGERKLHIACNQFCWINMYRRAGKDFNADLDKGLAEVKRSGMDGLEVMLGDAKTAERFAPLLKQHGLAMRSCYTSATLHDPSATDVSIDRVVATAKKARERIDLRIVVVNPTPLRGQAKSDEQLATQAKAMAQLGQRLDDLGMTLAYHFHAPAWQDDGREFHHLLGETDPKLVQLCLDTHWVFRGSGNNTQQVYEVIKQYGTRVAELHLRQSSDGVWTECMSDGDIDYHRVAEDLLAQGVRPLLVLEQAVEKGTPHTMDAIESHRRSRAYVEEVFAQWAST
jgi:inosose dehydratase